MQELCMNSLTIMVLLTKKFIYTTKAWFHKRFLNQTTYIHSWMKMEQKITSNQTTFNLFIIQTNMLFKPIHFSMMEQLDAWQMLMQFQATIQTEMEHTPWPFQRLKTVCITISLFCELPMQTIMMQTQI